MEIKSITGTVLFSNNSLTVLSTVESVVKAGSSLCRANLYRANLEWANLYRVNLEGANLEGVNLEGANLEGANLEGANLEGASLYRANLDRANLYRANLYRADLEEANLYRANLEGANLEGVNLDGANLDGANLDGANLDGASLSPDYTIRTFCQFINFAEWGPLLAFISDKGLVWIKIGCKSFSLEDAKKHWADKEDRAKTKLILKLVEEWAKLV